jgi:septal ring-binding cell division protein DamX
MSNHSNSAGKVIFISILIMILVGGGSWYAIVYKPKQDAIKKARQEQLASEAAKKKAEELAVLQKAEYDKLIIGADSAFDQQQWELAQSIYTSANSLLPNEIYAQERLALVNTKLDELAALKARNATGIVEIVSSPTNRFYILVSSSIDEDLAMDYARKLMREGNDVKLIAHRANQLPFYGVAVGDYATRAEADAAFSSFSNFSDKIWIFYY